jgi:hypothetical protein
MAQFVTDYFIAGLGMGFYSNLAVGSSLKTSSPTVALNIALSIPAVGLVKVSDLKSIMKRLFRQNYCTNILELE